jgi:methylase of polypeptide subunit release factors
MGLADEPDTHAARLMRMLGGKWIVQALAAAAELRLADILTEPLALAELARRAECQPEPLARLLRVLVGEGLLELLPDSRYELTPLGAELRRGALGELAEFVGSPSQWVPWNKLTQSIRTGECAFTASQGQSLFEYLTAHPEEARLYDTAVDAFTRQQAHELANHELMADVQSIVDVGGGRGTLLLELLKRRPNLQGILVDRPDVVATAAPRFDAAGLKGRYQLFGGDFFEALPEGADCYVIKHVIHNWSDADATKLLCACARAMAPGAKLLVVEGLLLPGNIRDLARYMDLEMLVLTESGKERSKPEFRKLFSRAGLKLASTHSLGLGAWLLVAQSGGGVSG